ncbi:MAG: ribonuclease HII [Bacteroidetes bacterium]|nr:MAG: ribonuclease HII [Bacteroidota bacterium]
MLKKRYTNNLIEAGCDEAGRGCLAGPVVAAAVILPADFENYILNDSKKMSESNRYLLRDIIEKEAVAWAIGEVDNNEIDKINILNASFLAMHRAIDKLIVTPEFLLIDGNRFNKYKDLPYETIIKGDGKYMSIAAASVLAKTYRDDLLIKKSKEYPVYQWEKNKSYGTKAHVAAIAKYGYSPYHRKSFVLKKQLKLNL